MTAGPLAGLRIVELAGIGPAPFAAMLLSDMGAEVVRVARPGDAGWPNPRFDLLSRGRRCVALDLKHDQGPATLLRLLERADGLIEGFRPGVMERLGLAPEDCWQRNPRLVYGRMTGWGQAGPLAQRAGHDINYIALAGVLQPIGRRDAAPTVPLNLVGDFGGGGLMLAFGMLCALQERVQSGRGQVVDAAMVDGAATLMTVFHGLQQAGFTSEQRGTNLLDSGAHFYDTYETADGQFISLGAFEPQFYALLLEKLGLPADEMPQMDRERWPELKRRIADCIRTRTRQQWCEELEGSDVCFAPVLTPAEARAHPHNRARRTFIEVEGVEQPAPAPRFSRSRPDPPRPPAHIGEHTDEVLAEWGFEASEIAALRAAGAIA